MTPEYGICPKCGRVVAVYYPRGGDGSVRRVGRHKYLYVGGKRQWCDGRFDTVEIWWPTRAEAETAKGEQR